MLSLLLISCFISISTLNATSFQPPEHRHCIILLDHDNTQENVNRPGRWYLMSKLQSAIAEQAAPILLHASLWNSFIERRMSFEQRAQRNSTLEHKIVTTYHKFQERIKYWSDYYTAESADTIHNKTLVIQRMNEEFYAKENRISITDAQYQLLLNYLTPFNTQEWQIYHNNNGFYLLIPKKYSQHYPVVGFKIEALQEVLHPFDIPSNYFESQHPSPLAKCLADFFVTYDDILDIPYTWNIVFSGHGGWHNDEPNKSPEIIWKTTIADLSVSEFQEVLEFFNSRVNTHLFHYATCMGSGNNLALAFDKDTQTPYNFAIISDALTDCYSFCKWTHFPEEFLSPDDIHYDQTDQCWRFSFSNSYQWNAFFQEISHIDFSSGSLENLSALLSHITHSSIADISLLRLPNTLEFYPLYPSDTIKIDARLLALSKTEDIPILIQGKRLVLLESTTVNPPIHFTTDLLRIISIKPGNATHYFKKITARYHVDLASTFWQAEGQFYSKAFVIDEFALAHDKESLIFKHIPATQETITLHKVIVTQQKNYGMRIFFTLDGTAMMVVAHKTDTWELNDRATIQEIVTLSPQAKEQYESHYESLKSVV